MKYMLTCAGLSYTISSETKEEIFNAVKWIKETVKDNPGCDITESFIFALIQCREFFNVEIS